ncbi:MAG: hypothetical protein ACFFB6_04520 [Promethearchaeota archaeon]
MREFLTPEKIQKDVLTGDLGKENAAELLISLIEGSDNIQTRVESIKALKKINVQSEKIFKIFEHCLISDENAVVRASVADYLIHYFLDAAVPALKWIIQHEKSPIVLKLLFESMKKIESPQMGVIERDLKIWNEDFASKIGIVPQESLFFLDLEVLFSKGTGNYEINPFSYKHFEAISDIKNGEPWLVINNNHVEILDFNYFKWKFIKNNEDIIKALSKLENLDFYLCSLSKYSQNDFREFDIPESIGSLKFLKKLTLRRNKLKKLPISFQELKVVEELDLSYNKFEEFPQVLLSLNTLKQLNITHNLIQSIPELLYNNIKIIR